MSRQSLRIAAFSLLALPLLATAAHAQWLENGTPFATESGNQYHVRALADGEGGAFIAWSDGRPGMVRIFLQRVDAYGRELWTPGGVMNPDVSGLQYDPLLVSDEAGGVILVYEDQSDLRAQRFDGDGNFLWDVDGEPVSLAANYQSYAHAAPDGAGGVLVSWQDTRLGPTVSDAYVQRLNANGAALWTADGVAVSTASNSQTYPRVAHDGAGGAFVTWFDYRNGNYDVFIQQFDDSGTALLTYNGEPVVSLSQNQQRPDILPDGAGGAVLVWDDYRSGYDIYAQRFDHDGSALWGTNGLAICTATGSQLFPRLAPDGEFGFLVCWQDDRSGDDDIYIQRFDLSGSVMWDVNGEALCTAPGDQQWPVLAPDGTGGAVVAWQDYRGPTQDIYARLIDETGAPVGPFGGTVMAVAPGLQGYQWAKSVVSDGAGGAFVFWDDQRTGEYDVYGQRLERNGYWGYPSPWIAEARDVPGDQGGQVYLAWDASRLDPWPELYIREYSIWRSLSPGRVLDTVKDNRGDDIRVERALGRTFYWEKVATVSAENHMPGYSLPVPTLFDSTSVSPGRHYFQVVAHILDPATNWASPPDSARSVDNLAPLAPARLAAKVVPNPVGLEISWRPNAEKDLDHYVVHRGADPGFVPGPGTLVATTADTTAVDAAWGWGDGWYYKVAAVDEHENVGPFALLEPGSVTGVDLPGAVARTFLGRNHPNPFNPRTTVVFGLAAAGPVDMEIYDLSGRRVRTLLERAHLPAGRREVVWDGDDDAGRRAAAGVYVLRMSAGGFSASRRLVMVK